MNLNSIILEALYEIKCTRRNILFKIFVLFALLGTIFLPFAFFPDGSRIKLGQFNLPWYAQSLSSSIPFMTAYYYNFVQLLLAIFITSNDLHRSKLTAMSALDSHSQNNTDVVAGKFIGRCIVFICVNMIVFLIAMCYNLVYYPNSFSVLYYLFYGITLTFPVLIYSLSLSILITRFINNQWISTLVLLIIGGAIFNGAGVMYGVFDPLARYIPNMFSDFTGHVNLENYLLQRGSVFLAGIGFLALSIIFYPRIPNCTFVFKRCISVACILFILAGAWLLLIISGKRQLMIPEIFTGKHTTNTWDAPKQM